MCNYIDMPDFYKRDLDSLCEYVDGELSEVLKLINCDVKVEVILRLGKAGRPYVACNNQTITQEKRLNILSGIDNRKVVLASKNIRFIDMCEDVKLYLRFDISAYEKYTNIKKYVSLINVNNASFLEAVLRQFIIAFENGYIHHKTDNSPYFSYYHMIQEAGNNFIGDISLILGYKAIENTLSGNEKVQYYFPTNLLSHINNISLLRYETSVAKGRILICTSHTVNYQYLDIQIDPFLLEEIKKVRKLLEITRENLILVVEGTVVLGFVTKEKIHKISIGSSVLFEINGPIEWTAFLISGDREDYLIHNQKNNYMYEHQKVDKNNFVSLIQSVLKDCDIDLIWDIVQCVINNSEHGAMIVFADNAKTEAERLKNSSFKIAPMTLSTDIIKHITSIDGAILFDAQGVCYSIGMILDGIQTKDQRENISNGARHNSAVRYLGYNPNCVIVVISEDGDLKIFSHIQ